MSILFKLVVVGLALMMVAYLIQTYANGWYSQIAFTAPIVGAMSYAYCALAVIGCLMLAKVNVGK
jgi:hypothetical protein